MLHRTAKLAIAAFSLIVASGCQAPLEIKQGVVGEFCTRDTDCRDPFICNSVTGLCSSTDTQGSALECPTGEAPKGDVSCEDMCEYLVNQCGRREDNCSGDDCFDACVSSCTQTIRCWSEDAATIFGNCSLGNTDPELTCDVAITAEAPSFCYSQIPLPEDRKAVCDDLIGAVGEYSPTASQGQLSDLAKFCYRLARAYSQDDFEAVYACDESRDTSLTQAEVVSCVNTVFNLDFDVPEEGTNNEPVNNASE